MTRGGADTIFMAAENGDLLRVRELVEAGVDVNAMENKATPLMLASARGNFEVAVYLIDHGADVNKVGNATGPAITWAIENESNDAAETIALLVKKGANVNVSLKTGYTPLHWAVESNLPDLVQLMIEHGAKLNVKTKDGDKPFDLISNNPHYRGTADQNKMKDLLSRVNNALENKGKLQAVNEVYEKKTGQDAIYGPAKLIAEMAGIKPAQPGVGPQHPAYKAKPDEKVNGKWKIGATRRKRKSKKTRKHK
jgi:ankyrin repeat protein